LTESSLSLDEAEGDFLLSAELGEPEDELDGVNVMSDDDELGSLVLN